MPITKQYLDSIQQLKRQFHIQKEFPSLILHSFWTPEEYKKLAKQVTIVREAERNGIEI